MGRRLEVVLLSPNVGELSEPLLVNAASKNKKVTSGELYQEESRKDKI